MLFNAGRLRASTRGLSADGMQFFGLITGFNIDPFYLVLVELLINSFISVEK